jgi:hypothetical protein
MKMIIVDQCCNWRQNFTLYFGLYSISEMPLPMELVGLWLSSLCEPVSICSVVCHMTSPEPFPRVRSSAFSNFQDPVFNWRLSSSCLHFLPCLPVTLILPSVFPSVTCFRKQFIHKMLPIHLAFCLLLVGYSSSLRVYNSFCTICMKNYKCKLWRPVSQWQLVL